MIFFFCKSLDRPLEIIGLRGKWITKFLMMAGGCILFAVVVAMATEAGFGIAIAIGGSVISLIVCTTIQGNVTHRQISRKKCSSRMKGYVKRRELLSYILKVEKKEEEK